MKALIYITIFLMSGIWFTSCKTSRNMETEKQIDYSGDFLYLQNLIESLRLDVNKQTKITTDKLSDLKIENKTVYLSSPDSTGKQYPIKESTTTASKQDQERTEVDETLLEYIAGFFAILGHTFPIFFEFRGGKGVATALGVLITLNWKIGLICLIFAVIIIAFTKMVSVGSILAAVLYPILTIFMGDVKFLPVMISILIALLVIFNHRENLKRIKNGTENKISFKK